MARPRKEGMDYFPHDVHAAADEKLEAMLMLHGAKGYAFFFLHLEYLYRRDNLVVKITKPFKAVMCAKMQITEDEYNQVLQTALECGLFDAERYAATNELFSHGVLKRAGVVFDEREKERARKNRNGKQQENQQGSPENEGSPESSGGFPPENESYPEFSGLKESKGKESKGKDIPNGISCAERLPDGNPSTPPDATADNPPEPVSKPYGIDIPLVDGTDYAVTEADVAQWQDAYPGVNVPDKLRRIRAWADANPKKRKTRRGIRRCINGWLAGDQDKIDRGRASPTATPGDRPAYPQPMTARQRYMHELGEALYPSIPEENPHEPVNVTPNVRQLGAAER